MHEFDLHIVRRDGTLIDGCEVPPSDLCRAGRYCDCLMRACRILKRRSDALGRDAWGDAIVHYVDGKAVFLSQVHAPRGRRSTISEQRVWIKATISRVAVITLHEVSRARGITFANAFALALAMQRPPVVFQSTDPFETVRTNVPASLAARIESVAMREGVPTEVVAARFIEAFVRPDEFVGAVEATAGTTKEAA